MSDQQSTSSSREVDAAIVAYLEAHAAGWRAAGLPSMAGLLLDLGRTWTARPLPPDVARGAAGDCYDNAHQLVLARPDLRLRYVEGVAIPLGLRTFVVEHAWTVDRSGRVLDPTWEDAAVARYYGIAIPLPTLRAMVAATGYSGFLCNDVSIGSPMVTVQRIPTVREIKAAARSLPRRRS